MNPDISNENKDAMIAEFESWMEKMSNDLNEKDAIISELHEWHETTLDHIFMLEQLLADQAAKYEARLALFRPQDAQKFKDRN